MEIYPGVETDNHSVFREQIHRDSYMYPRANAPIPCERYGTWFHLDDLDGLTHEYLTADVGYILSSHRSARLTVRLKVCSVECIRNELHPPPLSRLGMLVIP